MSGEPLRKAEVTITSTNHEDPLQYVATTAADGAFFIKGIEPGQYHLRTIRTGYVHADRPEMIPAPLTIMPGRLIAPIEVVLLPQAVVTGRILDEDGDPLQNARVSLLQRRPNSPSMRLVPYSRAQGHTNDAGEFRLAGIPPGSYLLCSASEAVSRHQHGRRISQGPEEVYGAIYYPDAVDPRGGHLIEVAMGAHLDGFELRMKKARAFHIVGRVELPGDADPQSVFLHLHPKMREGWAFGFSGPAPRHGDRFDFSGVLPGSYAITASCNAGDRSRQAVFEVEVTDHDLEGLVFRFPSGVTIPGIVRAEGGVGHVRVSLTGAAHRPGAQAAADRDGSFLLHDVVPGLYRIHLWKIPRDGYIKAVRYAGGEFSPDAIDITVPSPLEIELAFDSGTVAGVVENGDGTPHPGAAVQLWAGAESRYWSATDQDGRFEIRGVAPGEYRAVALDWSVDVRRKLEERGAAVGVDAGAHTSLTLPFL